MGIKQLIKKSDVVYHAALSTVADANRKKYERVSKDEKKLKEFMAKEYKRATGKTLNIPPKSYTEKIQFAKFYDSTPLKAKLTDKYAVREWVADTIGEQYLIPLLGVWDHYDEIDFSKLPEKFVLKTNNGSGTNLVVTDKASIDHKKAKRDFEFWLKQDFAFSGRGYELHYSLIKPKIIAEKYMTDKTGELNDYKFLCFNGEPHFVWVDVGRYSKHCRNVYDLEWNLQPWKQFTYDNSEKPIPKPENLQTMIELARKLSKGFGHVRVDLYNIDGNIYFGEMTFTNGKGFEMIYPEEANIMLGSLWKEYDE